MSNDKPQTARSYRGGIIDDNFSLHINIKWAIQCALIIVAAVVGYVRIENRIGDLERRMDIANEEIADLVDKHIADEEERYLEMEKQLQWYQKELNLNPLSWGKRKNK